jgi:hypothetical protein
MPLRDFRFVEYYRIKKDKSWDTQSILIPMEIPYEHCIDYIWGELSGLNLIDDLESISISNFPEIIMTTNSDGLV